MCGGFAALTSGPLERVCWWPGFAPPAGDLAFDLWYRYAVPACGSVIVETCESLPIFTGSTSNRSSNPGRRFAATPLRCYGLCCWPISGCRDRKGGLAFRVAGLPIQSVNTHNCGAAGPLPYGRG